MRGALLVAAAIAPLLANATGAPAAPDQSAPLETPVNGAKPKAVPQVEAKRPAAKPAATNRRPCRRYQTRPRRKHLQST